jgi:transposase
MFIRRVPRKSGEVGIVLVENYRENGHVKQRTIQYLGTESELNKKKSTCVEALKKKYNGKTSKASLIYLTLNPNEKIPKHNTVRNFGYFYLEKMYQELGLDEICNAIQRKSKIQYDLNDCLKLMCFMRALEPDSKKATLEESTDYFLEDYQLKLEDLYKALTVLSEHKDEFVSRMHQELKARYGRQTEILYYDVTNYFFEIDEPDTFRIKGCSKEHRPLPIVQMGLFIDQQSLPVDFYLYEGNKPDCTTLQPSFEEVKALYGADKIIVTADKGLNSASNLGYLLSQGNGYIVSQRIRGASKELRDEVLKDEGWEGVDSGDFEIKQFTRIINVTYPDKSKHEHNQKVVCIWSRKYQVKEKEERDNLLDKIAKLAADPKAFKRSCHMGMRKYIDEAIVNVETGEIEKDCKTHTAINHKKIAEDEALDGYYLIVTSENELSASEILNRYRGLWRIEQTFRITKSELQSRPVFVRTKAHIHAHFLTCFMALTMLRMLEVRLNRRYSCGKIIDGLRSAKASEIKKGFYSINKWDDVISEINSRYQIPLEKRYVKREELSLFRKQVLKAVYTTF